MTVWMAVLTTDVSNSNYRALCHTQLPHIIFLHCANRTTGVHLIPMLAALRNKSHAKLYKNRSRSQLVHAVCTTSLQATLATCLSAQATKTTKTANTRLNKTFQSQNHIPILFHTSKSFQGRRHVLQNNEHRVSRGNTLHTMQKTSKLIYHPQDSCSDLRLHFLLSGTMVALQFHLIIAV